MDRHVAQPGRAGLVGKQGHSRREPGSFGAHLSLGLSERDRHAAVPDRPFGRPLPVLAVRAVGLRPRDPGDGVDVRGTVVQHRRRRRRFRLQTAVGRRGGRRRLPGMHVGVDTSEQGVLGDVPAAGRGRGRVRGRRGRVVFVLVSPLHRSCEKSGGRTVCDRNSGHGDYARRHG